MNQQTLDVPSSQNQIQDSSKKDKIILNPQQRLSSQQPNQNSNDDVQQIEASQENLNQQQQGQAFNRLDNDQDYQSQDLIKKQSNEQNIQDNRQMSQNYQDQDCNDNTLLEYQEYFRDGESYNIMKKPKKAPNSYIIFRAGIRAKLLQNEPKLRQAQLNQIVAKQWRDLPPQLKKPYQDQSNTLRKQYMEKIKIYRQMKQRNEIREDVMPNNGYKKTNKTKKNKCKKIKKLLKLLQKQIQGDGEPQSDTLDDQFLSEQHKRSYNQRAGSMGNFQYNRMPEKGNLNWELRNFLMNSKKQLKQSKNKQRAMSQISKYLEDQTFTRSPMMMPKKRGRPSKRDAQIRYNYIMNQHQRIPPYYPHYLASQPQSSQYHHYPQYQEKRNLLQPQYNENYRNQNIMYSNGNSYQPVRIYRPNLNRQINQAQFKLKQPIRYPQMNSITAMVPMQRRDAYNSEVDNLISQIKQQKSEFENQQKIIYQIKRQQMKQEIQRAARYQQQRKIFQRPIFHQYKQR